MKLFKNKKGDVGGTGQQQLFYLAEIIIGAIVIVGGIYLTLNISGSTDTEVITKDISVLINTITHQTNNLAYTYALPEFVTQLKISKDSITLYSNKGSTTQKIKTKKDINLEPITLIMPSELPIFFLYDEGKISFEQGDKSSCTNLRLLDKKQKFVITTKGTNSEQETILNELKTYMEINDILKEIFSNENQNTEIELMFTEQNNFTITLPDSVEYEALNCYAKTMFQNENVIFQDLIIKEENQNKITIKIGQHQKIKELNKNEKTQILTTYSNQITQTMLRGKTN